ncbi:MAG: enoyl-CoA hydratase/isomerase family protein [Xanthobacteraceae bacterium]|nr:enoyl-CoA hydratase/isomerase family protein [Xanthobacteraceae bacterium]
MELPVSLASLDLDGRIGVIRIDNPPVNALNNALRAELVSILEGARQNAAIEGLVLACAGRTFIAGADISEFGQPPQRPTTIDVITAIEQMGKPVVAALFGTPMGGGFEVALGCHFRVAAPGTRVALPEIKLGLMPGAGGTQRLPRLAGMEKALAMILSGDPIDAKDALACGIVDEIADGDVTAAAVAFARRVSAEKRPLTLARDREEKLAALKRDPSQFEALAAKAARRVGGPVAPGRVLQALRDAIELPVPTALERERASFLELVASEESRAQRHIFFAEREAAKVADLRDTKPAEIKRAAVVGAGTMGSGIAMCFANAGIPVTMIENAQEALTRGLAAMEKNYQASAARGGLAKDEVARRLALVQPATDLAAVAEADIVVEAVFEDMGVKREVFTALDRLAKPGAVLATNTSYLDVNAIAATTARPDAVVGMHFFSPANVMRLLEVVRGAKTSPQALATAVGIGRKIGKAPVVVGVCHGFVGNRMHRIRSVETERILLEGALPREIDAAMTGFGFAMGPLAVSDLAGLDISWRMRKAEGFSAPIADQLCEMGRFGQKTGRGFYLYEPGSRSPRPDPEVEALIVATAKKRGVERRAFVPKDIVERLLFPMINEGARILDEGIAQRAGDIDVIWVFGYGFPNWRGGPMHYANTVGLAYVRDRLKQFATQTGDARHEPAPLLTKLVAEGKGFT